MANAKPMLQFLSQLNKTKAEKLTDVGIRIDSITKEITPKQMLFLILRIQNDL